MNAAVDQYLTARVGPDASVESRQAPEWFEGPTSPIWSRRYSDSVALGK